MDASNPNLNVKFFPLHFEKYWKSFKQKNQFQSQSG